MTGDRDFGRSWVQGWGESADDAYRRLLALIAETNPATVGGVVEICERERLLASGQTHRTALLATEFGTSIGLTLREVGVVRLTALLKDCGLCCIPLEAARRSDPWSLDDVQAYRMHAELGAAIVERCGLPAAVSLGVRHHHERWDGAGYPDRLAGEEIPLHARIVAIAGAWVEEARAEDGFDGARKRFESRIGNRLDPRLSETFLAFACGDFRRLRAA